MEGEGMRGKEEPSSWRMTLVSWCAGDWSVTFFLFSVVVCGGTTSMIFLAGFTTDSKKARCTRNIKHRSIKTPTLFESILFVLWMMKRQNSKKETQVNGTSVLRTALLFDVFRPNHLARKLLSLLFFVFVFSSGAPLVLRLKVLLSHTSTRSLLLSKLL